MIENKNNKIQDILDEVINEIKDNEEHKNLAQEIQDLRLVGYQKIDADEEIKDKDSQKKEFDKLLKQTIFDKIPLYFSRMEFDYEYYNYNDDMSYSNYVDKIKKFQQEIKEEQDNIGQLKQKNRI